MANLRYSKRRKVADEGQMEWECSHIYFSELKKRKGVCKVKETTILPMVACAHFPVQ